MTLEPRDDSSLLERIRTRQAKVGVIGLGYVGLPLAVEFASQGFDVTGFDVDHSKTAQINAGKSYIPDVPAAAEILPGYDFASWGGMFAPAGTPRAVVMKLNAAVGAALELPDISRRFGDMGLVPRHSTPEAFGQFLQAEIKRWRELLAKKPN